MTSGWDKLGFSGSLALADFEPVHNISSSQLDFTKECSLSVAYFQRADFCRFYHKESCDFWPSSQWQAVDAALPLEVKKEQQKKTSPMSDLRVFWSYIDEQGVPYVNWSLVGLHHAWYDGFTNIVLEDGMGSIHAALEASLTDCLPAFCQEAGFVGNPDITGIGAYVAYVTIAVLTTIVNLVCIYLTWSSAKPLDDAGIKSSRVWTATVAASLSFLDTLLYTNIMIAVAGCLYHFLGKSIYEKSTSMLVADFVASATFSSSILYRYSHDGMPLQIFLQTLPTAVRFFMVNSGISYMEANPFADSLCIGRPNFALSHLKTSFYVQMGVVIAIVCGIPAAFLVHILRSPSTASQPSGTYMLLAYWKTFKQSRISRFVWAMASITLLGYMLMCLVFISQIRAKARYWFAKSYEDNEMGYGQIIAMGFCVQTVITFLYELITFKSLKRKTTMEMLEPRPPQTPQNTNTTTNTNKPTDSKPQTSVAASASKPSVQTLSSSTTSSPSASASSITNSSTSSASTITTTSAPNTTLESSGAKMQPAITASSTLISRSSSKLANP